MYDTPQHERVARGAALLDQKVPGWHRNIDVDKIDVSNPFCCPASVGCGMPYGDAKKEVLGILGQPGWVYGFNIREHSENRHENRQGYEELKRLWVEEVESRLLLDEFEGLTGEEVRTECAAI